MKINQKKTKLMVINGKEEDRFLIQCGNMKIDHCETYIYLGATFTADGNMSSVLDLEAQQAQRDVNKFSVFIAKNSNMPFPLKKKVAEAAVMSSILYSSESWLTNNVSMIRKTYMMILKTLLGVRITTPNKLCLIESGFLDIESLIKLKRGKFARDIEGNADPNDPIMKVLKLCAQKNTRGYKIYMRDNQQYEELNKNCTADLKNQCYEDAGRHSKTDMYLKINPNLSMHDIYLKYNIPDYQRIAVTHFRLSSHNLLVEKLCWSRTPRELRTCPCDDISIQDEHHVVFECPTTEAIRINYQIYVTELKDLFNQPDINRTCSFIYNIMCKY
jgi:hypothetical protein